MIILLTFILIYILSVITHIVLIYILQTDCETIGDVLDYSEPFMYMPLVNTMALFIGLLILVKFYISKILKLNKLWNNIRSIKIKRTKDDKGFRQV